VAGNKYDVKITVLKKIEVPDVHKEYAADGVHINCAKYKEGQEYLCKNVEKPEGFCSWAWVAVQDKVVFLALGHDYPWIKQKGVEIVSCADGLHPVLYKLERIEN
jgi:uncharacterized repeat protein (TIGR04076 family)